jgi:hypothetical protein
MTREKCGHLWIIHAMWEPKQVRSLYCELVTVIVPRIPETANRMLPSQMSLYANEVSRKGVEFSDKRAMRLDAENVMLQSIDLEDNCDRCMCRCLRK